METVICNIQRGIAPKLYKPELWFLHSAYCLMLFYICVKFHQNTINSICNVQSSITPKLYKLVLLFLHSAYCFMMFYICVKFHKNHEWFSSYSVETVIHNVQKAITPKLYKPRGPKSISFELLCLSWLPATLMMIRSKMNELAWRHHFPIISLWEMFLDLKGS